MGEQTVVTNEEISGADPVQAGECSYKPPPAQPAPQAIVPDLSSDSTATNVPVADRLAEWGLRGVLRGLHHELDALAAQGDTVSAKEKFAKALELEPKNPAFQKYKAKP